MKGTEINTTDSGVKVTVTTCFDAAECLTRVTKTASVKHRGRTLQLQSVTIIDADGKSKVLYNQQRVAGKKAGFNVLDSFAWIQLGYGLSKKFSVAENNESQSNESVPKVSNKFQFRLRYLAIACCVGSLSGAVYFLIH